MTARVDVVVIILLMLGRKKEMWRPDLVSSLSIIMIMSESRK